jgi:hypothetical protein
MRGAARRTMPIQLPSERLSIVRPGARIAGDRSLRLFVLLGLALVLGACSKCDVPTPWEHSAAPASCHDGPQPQ